MARNQLKDRIEVMQDRYIRREQEYRKTITEYEKEINENGNISQVELDDSSLKNIDDLKQNHSKILKNIEDVQKRTTRILQEKEKEITHNYDKKLKELKNELDEEKTRKCEGIGNFAEKESQLTRELEIMRASTDVIENQNKMLTQQNSTLKIDFKSQENDVDILLRQLFNCRKENEHLKEEISNYEELASQSGFSEEGSVRSITSPTGKSQKSKKGLTSPSPFNLRSTGMRPSSGRSETQRYQRHINTLKKLTEQEKANLRAIKTSYANELHSRTELENLLRQCVEDVKTEITHRRSDLRRQHRYEDEFDLSENDREKILEVLLSQERVLTLLYDKTFPPRAIAKESYSLESESRISQCMAHVSDSVANLQGVYEKFQEEYAVDTDAIQYENL